MARLRLDPFAADYDPAIQIDEGDEPAAAVDTRIEQEAWEAVRPTPPSAVPRMFFVDGVRRVEHRILLEDDRQQSYGLLGSFGVGATRVDGKVARITHEAVGRRCVVAGGLLGPAVESRVGDTSLVFEPRVVPENTPLAPIEGLQSAMREDEARLADTLSAQADLVLLDGPLTFLASGRGPVVGFVKRLMRPYLAAPALALLRCLAVGERTPLFLIEDARAPRYSWYQRLAQGRRIESALTGIVRLEASGALALAAVRTLADACASLLPRYASDSAHDPRAPHNLYPIGGLETRLRRLLGDPLLIRRAIEASLHEEAA